MYEFLYGLVGIHLYGFLIFEKTDFYHYHLATLSQFGSQPAAATTCARIYNLLIIIIETEAEPFPPLSHSLSVYASVCISLYAEV